MANTNPSVRACVLKVDVKCCSGCQKKATTKLQSLAGVSAAEYNAEKGLMTVTGDMDPITLVQKLTRWGKKAELVSVNYTLDDFISDEDEEEGEDENSDEDDTCSDDTSSNPDPRPMERETQVNMRTTIKKEEGRLRKYLLFGCLGSKSKVVQPPLAKKVFGSSKFGNGFDLGGYGNPTLPRRPPPPFHGPMNPQQQHQMMMQQQQSHPQFQKPGPPMPLIQQSARPERPPYFMLMDPQYREAAGIMLPQPAKPNPQMTINNNLHYNGK